MKLLHQTVLNFMHLILQNGGHSVANLLPVSCLAKCDIYEGLRLSAYQISSKSDHRQPSYDVIAIFKMAAVSHVGFAMG